MRVYLYRLCKLYNLDIVLSHLSHYFNASLFGKLEPPPQDSESTTMDVDDIGELQLCLDIILWSHWTFLIIDQLKSFTEKQKICASRRCIKPALPISATSMYSGFQCTLYFNTGLTIRMKLRLSQGQQRHFCCDLYKLLWHSFTPLMK